MPSHTPERSELLAEAAFRMFSRYGLDGVNIGRVAQEAGVTKGSLYWHFDSKQELIEAACVYYYRTSLRRMRLEADAVSDPLSRLVQVLRLAVRSCLMDSENRLFTMEILTLAMHEETIRQGWRQFYENCRKFFIGLVEDVCAAGQLEVPAPERAVNLMLEAIEGIKLRAMFEPQICSPAEERQIVDDLMTILRFAGREAEPIQ